MIKLLDILREIVTATQVICDNCGWKWDIADGGDDLYICHKCNHDPVIFLSVFYHLYFHINLFQIYAIFLDIM